MGLRKEVYEAKGQGWGEGAFSELGLLESAVCKGGNVGEIGGVHLGAWAEITLEIV